LSRNTRDPKLSYGKNHKSLSHLVLERYQDVTHTTHKTPRQNHRHRRAVAQPCVNGDRLSQRRMAKFDLTQIRNPSTDWHKMWNRWLRPQDDPLCKLLCKSVHWGLLGKWVKYNENFSSIPFF